MKPSDLERAARWCEEQIGSDLEMAAFRAVAFKMREEATKGIHIEPLSPMSDDLRELIKLWNETEYGYSL